MNTRYCSKNSDCHTYTVNVLQAYIMPFQEYVIAHCSVSSLALVTTPVTEAQFLRITLPLTS